MWSGLRIMQNSFRDAKGISKLFSDSKINNMIFNMRH